MESALAQPGGTSETSQSWGPSQELPERQNNRLDGHSVAQRQRRQTGVRVGNRKMEARRVRTCPFEYARSVQLQEKARSHYFQSCLPGTDKGSELTHRQSRGRNGGTPRSVVATSIVMGEGVSTPQSLSVS